MAATTLIAIPCKDNEDIVDGDCIYNFITRRMDVEEKNDYIQLPPMKKDTSADVVSFIWEYMKLPEELRKKVKAEMDEIREHCRDSDFQRPDLYETVSKEEVAGIEKSMQKIIADIITEASGIACWVYVEKYVHHRSLKEMLEERGDADTFIVVIDTWFEKILGA